MRHLMPPLCRHQKESRRRHRETTITRPRLILFTALILSGCDSPLQGVVEISYDDGMDDGDSYDFESMPYQTEGEFYLKTHQRDISEK